jgi:YidC/Oxa1 family membrane protein insertase
MEKRVLLAVILSFVVLYGYQVLFPPPKPAERTAPAPQTPPPAVAPPPAAGPAQTQKPEAAPVEASKPAAAAVVGDMAERDIVVESEFVRAIFSTRGAVLKSWRLKQYQDAAGQPLELIRQNVPPGTPRPFTLSFDDAEATAALRGALFKPSATELQVGNTPATLTFDYEDAAGLTAHKQFTFPPDVRYAIDFSAKVARGAEPLVPAVQWGPAIGSGVTPKSSMGIYSPPSQPIFYRDGEATRVDRSEIAANASQQGNLLFAGVDDHYFLSAMVANKQPVTVRYEPLELPAESGEETSPLLVLWSAKFQSQPEGVRFFFGPKDFDALRSIDPQLTYAIDFGMFRWFVVPLHNALRKINEYVGNWGWSIIILTAFINLAMFPLRHKSVVSMRKMQELQPEVKAIQDRYKNLKMSDPARQKQNVELMNLYRERGVNPASGCVPMLLTLPVLIAFYAMLSVAVELRGAPFIFWIRDLSKYDPLYITPVLMGATQLIQTRMTPTTTTDPMQQKMLLIMPIVFTAMFIFMPSGLVLYWTASNIWAIGQQAVTNKLIGPTAKRSARPPAERKVKSAGGGKTDQAAKGERK